MAILFALAACGDIKTASFAVNQPDRLFLGGVAADEPRAVQIGERVLFRGGTAADAAVAVYFALSVTLPSAASLGGGGVCIYHDAATKKTETLDFLTRAPAAVPPGTERPSAIPGNGTGFLALHGRFGRLPWSQLVAPAENLARFGAPMSRALAADLVPIFGAFVEDPVARRIFVRPDGLSTAEGQLFKQEDLADTLSVMRTDGPDELYRGVLAKKFVDAVNRSGGAITLEDLKNYHPRWVPPIAYVFGNSTAYFPQPPAAAGLLEAQLFGMIEDSDLMDESDPVDRAHGFAEMSMRAFAERGRWMRPDGTTAGNISSLISPDHIEQLLANMDSAHHTPAGSLRPPPPPRPENPSATGFVTVDGEGSAAACALTMNNAFGTGRFAGRTGILLAAIPQGAGRLPTALGPMMVMRAKSNQFIFAAAAGGSASVPGGVAAPTALMNVAAQTLLGEVGLEQAMTSKRVHHGGNPDLTYYEPGYDAGVLRGLKARGHHLAATRNLGLVNAASCPGGLPRDPGTCVLRTDPRGSGLAVTLER